MNGNEIKDYVSLIYPRENHDRVLVSIKKKRLKIFIIAAIGIILVWIACFFSEEDSPLTKGTIVRQEDSYELEMQVSGTGKDGLWQEQMTFEIEPRKLSPDERNALSKKVKENLGKIVLGNNKSFEHVENDLNFVSQIKDCQAKISWRYDDEYFLDTGEIRDENMDEKGTHTEIVAEASYLDWKEEFSYEVFIISSLAENKQRKNHIKKEIQQTLDEQDAEATIYLPKSIEEQKISYQGKDEGKNYTPVYCLLVLFFLLPILWHENQKKKMEQRSEQMLSDHPGVVNKIMLLLGAGLTVRKAVERLVQEYEKDLKDGKEMRYAYEELCIMHQEMQDGKPEELALEAFGKRCRLLPYMRFASVVSQNIKKGAEGILTILEGDALEALEQRKARVLAQGEKAGTKLLFPMMIMLGLVMGIIMIPAFMSM